jgi:hypothetical protein
MLHNPRYAGTFSYGRTSVHRHGDGHVSVERLLRDQWQVLIREAHVGYITWPSTSGTWLSCARQPRATEPNVAPAHHVKDQRYCRGWWYAADAATG